MQARNDGSDYRGAKVTYVRCREISEQHPVLDSLHLLKKGRQVVLWIVRRKGLDRLEVYTLV